MRILGLDLALGLTGWAVVDPGPTLVASGTFSLPSRRRNENRAAWNERRYSALRDVIGQLAFEHRPAVVAYEFPDKPRSVWSGGSKGREFHAVQGLGLAEGMLIGVRGSLNHRFNGARVVNLFAVSTSEAKRAVTGRVGASKGDVLVRLRLEYGWTFPTEDESDAAAICLAAMRLRELEVA